MKIVNKIKFIKSILIILLAIICFSLILNKSSFSFEETKYKSLIISNGDTLWSIAKEEKNNNDYFKNKDIRDVVYELKCINNLNDSNLKIGEKLIIPNI